MAVSLPDLPYDLDALEPHVSADTLALHHGKHHRGYVDKLNAAIEGTPHDDADLETIVRAASEANDTAVFNNAAQAWNHAFLWLSMSPSGGGDPSGPLGEAIAAAFGDAEAFRERFKEAASGQFGSGWAWLVADAGRLRITTTSNADTPLTGDSTPVLTLDVWEHAYYLDYRNERGKYVDAFLRELINWDFAARNFAETRAAA